MGDHGAPRQTAPVPQRPGRSLLIKLFLASPGDVHDERAIAREIVERLNRTLGRQLGCVVDLYGWEDRAPAYGRPQQQINVDVDGADVVVGLLRSRWGSPSGTHTSGFAEEIERAMDRRRATGAPDIMLYFLHAPNGRDQPVADLRSELIAGKELLFKELGEHERFADEFHDALIEHIVAQSLRELHRAESADAAEPPAPSVTEDVELARYVLARAINQLPERQKIAITLVDYEGLAINEVAQIMGVTSNTARGWYRSALQELAARTAKP